MRTANTADHGLRRQALWRLALVVAVVIVGIALVGWNSFKSRQEREVAQKLEIARNYYEVRLPELEAEWQARAHQARLRLEFAGILEDLRERRQPRLDAYLEAQGPPLSFPNLLILDDRHQVVYRHGPALDLPAALPCLQGGWCYFPDPGSLYRAYAEPVRLEAGHQGTLVLLRRLDAVTLRSLAIPETHLHLVMQGHTVASSESASPPEPEVTGLLNDRQPPVIQVAMAWPGGGAAKPILYVHREFHDSFPLPEFLLRPATAIVLVVVMLWLGLGNWLARGIRRIESLGEAVRQFQRERSRATAVQAMAPARTAADEIHQVADALADLMDSVQARDQEQQAYLDTLSLVEEAVLELDCKGVVLLASSGWQRLTHRSDSIVGRPLADFLHSDDGDAMVALCSAFARSEKTQAQVRLRLRGEHPGQEQWVECRFVSRVDPDGRATGSRGVLRDITQTYLHEKQISHMALHDALTELPNRVLLEDRLKVALRMADRSQHRLAVCFVDLDHFKNVNDNLGHKAGDKLLVAFARKVRALTRTGDTLARWGGDEFVLLLPALASAAEARQVLAEMAAAFREPIPVDDTEFVVTFSIGVSLYPDDGCDVEALLSHADRAMFYAKAQGRNQVCLFGEIAAKGSGRQELYLQQKLAEAVAKGRIEAWFQPVVDAVGGDCREVEVLARWHDPDSGWISPATFIPMAENIGVIRDLGRQIWLQALAAAQEWHQAGHRLRIAVNISKRQLFSPYITEQLLDELAAHGLSPKDVVLEVTESLALLDAANTAEHLATLQQAGFSIAIDDFGTGYSSLSQLHEMPVDQLKIDISFVRRLQEPTGQSMVRAIIQLAGALKLQTVAEGVEDETAATQLRQLGVDRLQGYWFAKPMPRGELGRWLSQRRGG